MGGTYTSVEFTHPHEARVNLPSTEPAARVEIADPTGTTEKGNTIKIASFNIKWFSHQKAGDPFKGPIIVDTISKFDIMAIQKIRDSSNKTFEILKTSLSELGYDYDCVIGPLLPYGNQKYKERYAFIYNTETIERLSGDFTFDDSQNDLFEREPYYAHFKAKNGNFDFVMVNIHTKPKNATAEIYDLTKAISSVRNKFPGEPDIIVLGDYNADCKDGDEYFDETDMSVPLRSDQYIWLIPNSADTNLAPDDCTYDRIVITISGQEDYREGKWGVYRFDTIHNLSYDKAKKVSDHYPVWAEFWIDRDSD